MSHGDAGLHVPDFFEALCAAVTEAVQDLHCPGCWQCAMSHGDAGLNMPDVFEALGAAAAKAVQDLIGQDVGNVLRAMAMLASTCLTSSRLFVQP